MKLHIAVRYSDPPFNMKSRIRTASLFGAILTTISSSSAGRLLGSSFGVPGKNLTYDYVVVGGGTAGLTIATRLVQQKAGTVAVIEAGSFYELDNGNGSQVPATDSEFITKQATDWQPLIDWGYETVPQTVSLPFFAGHGISSRKITASC